MARIAVKGPEEELELVNASCDAEHLAYPMEYVHDRNDGPWRTTVIAAKGPELEPEPVNASCDAEHLAYPLQYGSIRGRHDCTVGSYGDLLRVDGQKIALMRSDD